MSMNTILLSVLTNRKKVLVAKVDKNKGGHWNEISSVISNYIYIYTEKAIYCCKCFQGIYPVNCH